MGQRSWDNIGVFRLILGFFWGTGGGSLKSRFITVYYLIMYSLIIRTVLQRPTEKLCGVLIRGSHMTWIMLLVYELYIILTSYKTTYLIR